MKRLEQADAGHGAGEGSSDAAAELKEATKRLKKRECEC